MATKLLTEWIDGLESDLGLQIQDVAGAVSTSPRTVERWREGVTFPQREARSRLDELYDLVRHLYQTFGRSDLARQWLHTENSYLGMMKPTEALRAGRIDAIEGALAAMDYGFLA